MFSPPPPGVLNETTGGKSTKLLTEGSRVTAVNIFYLIMSKHKMCINPDTIIGYVKHLLSSNPGFGLTGPDPEVLVNTD